MDADVNGNEATKISDAVTFAVTHSTTLIEATRESLSHSTNDGEASRVKMNDESATQLLEQSENEATKLIAAAIHHEDG